MPAGGSAEQQRAWGTGLLGRPPKQRPGHACHGHAPRGPTGQVAAAQSHTGLQQSCAVRSGHVGTRLGPPVCYLLSYPPRVEAAPGVGRCGLDSTPATLLVPDTSRKKVMEEGIMASPGEGVLPTLGVRVHTSVNCQASHPPSHFGTLAWALPGGCWVALCCPRPATQARARLSVPGWLGQSYGWQGHPILVWG